MNDEDGDRRIGLLETEIARLNGMLASTPDFIMRIDVDGKLLYVNRLAPGFNLDEVLGTSFEAYVPSEYVQRAREALREALVTRSTRQYATAGMVAPGRMGTYLTRVSPIIERDEVTSFVMVSTDVTELEENRTLLQLALDATGLGIWTHDPDAGQVTWDRRTRQIFGLADGDATPSLAEIMAERIHPEDREIVNQCLNDALQNGRFGPVRHRIVLPDGSVRWVVASGVVLTRPGGELQRLVGSVQDITEWRALETRLFEAQKLESIGRLAGGVAHDFNNMLTVILGNVELMEGRSSMDAIRENVAEIRDAAVRSSTLTAQLLAFARRQVMEPKVVDPNRLIVGLEALLRRVLGDSIRVSYALQSRGKVRVDPGQFEQVLMNLVSNARDAMPRGGSVRLATGDVSIGEAGSRLAAELPAGEYVSLSVADTGTGISPDALPHVFEPFFTTRPHGTGLGLATCHGIAKQSGGHLVAHSPPGEGATLTLYLPRLSESAELSVSGGAVLAPSAAAGSERILLVEDEPAVRGVIQRTLERQRYRVATARSAEEALQLVATAEPFDVLVTDLSMPGMGGHELAAVLRQRFPCLKILLVSGNPESAVGSDGLVEAGVELLVKPFTPTELIDRLRQLVERSTETPRGPGPDRSAPA